LKKQTLVGLAALMTLFLIIPTVYSKTDNENNPFNIILSKLQTINTKLDTIINTPSESDGYVRATEVYESVQPAGEQAIIIMFSCDQPWELEGILLYYDDDPVFDGMIRKAELALWDSENSKVYELGKVDLMNEKTDIRGFDMLTWMGVKPAVLPDKGYRVWAWLYDETGTPFYSTGDEVLRVTIIYNAPADAEVTITQFFD